MINPRAKFEVCTFSHSRDIRGSQNLKVDLILYFWISISWSPVELQISAWLDLLFWRYCHCNISAFWLANAYSGVFLTVLGDFDPLKLWYHCSNPQRNAIFRETRVLVLVLLTLFVKIGPAVWPSAALKNKASADHKHFTPSWGSRPWTDWYAIWGAGWRPRRNHSCQICCQLVKGFLGGSTPKSAISYTFWTTLTTVLHYRADCDLGLLLQSIQETHQQIR